MNRLWRLPVVGRLIPIVAVAIVALGILTPSILAATGSAGFSQRAGHIGDEVTVTVDSFDCDDYDIPRLRLRFVHYDAGVTVFATVRMRRISMATYTFAVPAIAAGAYNVEIECDPGDWVGFSVDSGGTAGTFRVLGGAPETSTVDPIGGPTSPSWWPPALLGCGLVGLVVTLGRPTIRPRSPRR